MTIPQKTTKIDIIYISDYKGVIQTFTLHLNFDKLLSLHKPRLSAQNGAIFRFYNNNQLTLEEFVPMSFEDLTEII